MSDFMRNFTILIFIRFYFPCLDLKFLIFFFFLRNKIPQKKKNGGTLFRHSYRPINSWHRTIDAFEGQNGRHCFCILTRPWPIWVPSPQWLALFVGLSGLQPFGDNRALLLIKALGHNRYPSLTLLYLIFTIYCGHLWKYNSTDFSNFLKVVLFSFVNFFKIIRE